MCNKIKYTKREANTALKSCRKFRRKQFRKEKRIYHCPDCNMWHLTSRE